jgi:hypothetical protein
MEDHRYRAQVASCFLVVICSRIIEAHTRSFSKVIQKHAPLLLFYLFPMSASELVEHISSPALFAAHPLPNTNDPFPPLLSRYFSISNRPVRSFGEPSSDIDASRVGDTVFLQASLER